MKRIDMQSTVTRFCIDESEGPSCQAVLDCIRGESPEIYLIITVPDTLPLDEIETDLDWVERDPPFKMDDHTMFTLELIAKPELPVMERYGFAVIVAEKILSTFERHLKGAPLEVRFNAPKTLQ